MGKSKKRRLEKQKRLRKQEFNKYAKLSWKKTKLKSAGYEKDINIVIDDLQDLSKQNYIDKTDTNAKILKNKHQARIQANIYNKLVDKEAKGKLQENELEVFRKIVQREPKDGYNRNLK